MRYRVALLFAAAAMVAGCVETGSTSPPPDQPVSSVPMHAAKHTPKPKHSPTPTPSGPIQVSDPGQVTGTLTGPCHAGDNGTMPDPTCTPGAYDPTLTAAQLCPVAHTSTYRPPESQTSAFKYGEAYPAYGDPRSDTSELDHLIPLELGGANDAANLWPELGSPPNPKDAVENKLHAWVCAGGSTGTENKRLSEARLAIARDWVTAESVLGVS